MTHFALLLQVKEDAPKLVGNSVECLIYSRTVLSSFYLVEFVSFESVKKTTRKPKERRDQNLNQGILLIMMAVFSDSQGP